MNEEGQAENNVQGNGNRSTVSLAQLRQVCQEFRPDEEVGNVEQRWKQWIENLEYCLEFEGIEEEKKKRAALLAVAGRQLREVFSTLEEGEEKTYTKAKEALDTHFKGKKNVIAERYRFFCMKPESTSEMHDHWITRLKAKGKECEFEKMDMKEAIKLVVTLHTPIDRQATVRNVSERYDI